MSAPSVADQRDESLTPAKVGVVSVRLGPGYQPMPASTGSTAIQPLTVATVSTSRPTPLGVRPPRHLELSIFTLLCWFPFGIIAFAHGSKVESAWNAGNRERAWKASESAGRWSWAGIVFGLFIWISVPAIVIAYVLATQ